MIYQFTQNGLPPDCHAELQTVMLNVVKHLLQMTCSVNMYIITISFVGFPSFHAIIILFRLLTPKFQLLPSFSTSGHYIIPSTL